MGLGQLIERPLRAIFGREVKAAAPLIDAGARQAELLAKGRLIAAKAEARLQARTIVDDAMGAKAVRVKAALEDMGIGGVRVTGKGAKRTLSMPTPVVSANNFSSMQKDFASLQNSFGPFLCVNYFFPVILHPLVNIIPSKPYQTANPIMGKLSRLNH